MKTLKTFSLFLMASVYLFGGVMHFISPVFYTNQMPPYFPLHLEMVYLSGIVEIGLGILLLFPAYRAFAAWCIIAMLLVFLLPHIYTVQMKGTNMGVPEWSAWLRLPIQGVLILWAYWHRK